MNGIIIDSGLFIAEERGKYDLHAFFQAHHGAAFAVSAITISEMWHGVERVEPSLKIVKAAKVSKLLEQVAVFDFTEEIAHTHAQLWATLEKAGERIGAHDMIIAATCLHHGYSLATLNGKEFKRIRGLTLLRIN